MICKLKMVIITKLQRPILSVFIALLALVLTRVTLVNADDPGDLDFSFGGTGIITTPVGGGFDFGRSVALQSDNKVVVAGYADGGVSGFDFAIIRYSITGSLDTTFNGGGIVTTPVSSENDHGEAVAIQPDGKIVVAGDSQHNGNIDFAVVRYTLTGSLDNTFNGTGIITTPISSENEWGQSVALQSDGKIVVAGSIANNGKYDIALVRYTITGSLDTAFNDTGIVTTPIGSSYPHHSVAIQPDGKIVVVGDSGTDSGSLDFAVVRYTITGSLDTTFNDTGIVTTAIGNGDDYARAVTIQSDNKIVVVGAVDKGGFDFNVGVVRYTITGSLDSTFNGTGLVTSPIGSGNDIAIQPNGKLIVAGSDGGVGNWDFSVVRYNPNGGLDTTFNNTGMITTHIDGVDTGVSVAIQSDGKIVVAGGTGNGAGSGDFAVVRYLGDNFATYLPIILKQKQG